MKKSAGIATSNERAANVQAYEAPGVGLILRMERGVRRLIGTGSRRSAIGESPETEREREPVRGARRSAMDAGLTGGISFFGGSNDGHRR